MDATHSVMTRKVLCVSIVLLAILCSGCALKKDNSTEKTGNTVPKPTKIETTNKGISYEPIIKEIFKGKVDKENLFQIYEFQYTGVPEDKKVGIYVNMPSCFTGEKMVEWDATQTTEGSVFSGSGFFAKNEKNVLISVYTSTDNSTPPTKDYYTPYGQKISFDGSLKNILDGSTDEKGQYVLTLYMKGIYSNLWQIQIKAPEQWIRSNQVIIMQFLDSIVALDVNDEVIVQDQ